MHEDQVIARARQQVSQRRVAMAEYQWRGPSQWLLPGLLLMVLITLFALPGALPMATWIKAFHPLTRHPL